MEYTILISSLVLFASCVTGQWHDPPIRCPAVCQIVCEYGNVMINGCPICQCNPAPSCCPRNSIPVFPERSCNPLDVFDRQCDYNEFCSTAYRSRSTGICCRRSMAPTEVYCPPNVVRDLGTCLLTKDNCLSQGDCPPSKKCCPWGCGKICVNA